VKSWAHSSDSSRVVGKGISTGAVVDQKSLRRHSGPNHVESLRMALAPGTRLGPYEIQAPTGAGGMGEVYRAQDTRLDRRGRRARPRKSTLDSRHEEDP
jgi:serine/threonine protein kinase